MNPSNSQTNFIIVDDDPVNNIICQKIIHNVLPDSRVQTFTDPAAGLEHIRTASLTGETPNTILLLDINMPDMSGWEFMERFVTLDNANFVDVYILSSSVDEADKRRAESNPKIIDYVVKPLDPSKVQDFISPKKQ